MNRWGLKGTLVAIGDLHAPFHSSKYLDWVLNIIEREKPHYVVQIGDLYDFYSWSRYGRNMSVMTPFDELALGQAVAADMWKDIKAPEKIQLLGNHDDRPAKRLAERFPEMEPFVDLRNPFTFPGVRTEFDSAQEVHVGNLILMHGFRSKMGDHARWNQQSTIVGHSHVGGNTWHTNRSGPFFELNAGCGVDRAAPVFKYRNQRTYDGWTLGVGVVDELGPRFLPAPF